MSIFEPAIRLRVVDVFRINDLNDPGLKQHDTLFITPDQGLFDGISVDYFLNLTYADLRDLSEKLTATWSKHLGTCLDELVPRIYIHTNYGVPERPCKNTIIDMELQKKDASSLHFRAWRAWGVWDTFFEEEFKDIDPEIYLDFLAKLADEEFRKNTNGYDWLRANR